MSKTVIIGGGIAGLTSGIYALLSGHEAVVIESHGTPGGNLTGWERKGCRIDNCLHWLTGTNPVSDTYGIWKTTGMIDEKGTVASDRLYTYRHGNTELTLWRDIDLLESDLSAAAPGDKKEIGRFIRDIKAMKAMLGIGGESNDRKSTAAEKAKAVPRLLKYYGMNCSDLANRFASPAIRGFICSILTGEFGALALLSVFATFTSGNGDLPHDDSLSVAKKIAERFVLLGGKLVLGTKAAKINVKNGTALSVTLENGRTVAADKIIAACDAGVTFGTLVDEKYMPTALKKRYSDKRLIRFSSCHCAFSCDCRIPFKGDYTIRLPQELKEKYKADHMVLREFKRSRGSEKPVLQAMYFCLEDECRRIITLYGRPREYRNFKHELRSDIESAVCAAFPQLAGKLDCIDVWTPATYKRYTGAETGSYMSFAFTSGVIPSAVPSAVKGVKNLYLATQWQTMPGGLPMAANAGVNAIKAIERAEKRGNLKSSVISAFDRARYFSYRKSPN